MQFLTDTKIDFMKYRGFFVWVSLLLLIISAVELFALTGLNLGIDFAGGTQLTASLRDEPRIDELRDVLNAAGLGEAQIQRYGDVDSQEVLIKAPVVGGSEEGSADVVIKALHDFLNRDQSAPFDLNQHGTESLEALLSGADPDGRGVEEAPAYYAGVADAIMAQRKDLRLFHSWDEIAGISEVSEATLGTLKAQAFLGAFHILQNENVGPQIGSELTRKGILSVALSLVGMLLYIWYRFELRYGIGALVAV
ncbi:MAG: hypothetical protein GY856_27550, partial [bacterium]|nr:hypothetical protein [bacterium]